MIPMASSRTGPCNRESLAALIPKFASIRRATSDRMKNASKVRASGYGGATARRIMAISTATRVMSETRSIIWISGTKRPSGSLLKLIPGKRPCRINSALAIISTRKHQKMTRWTMPYGFLIPRSWANPYRRVSPIRWPMSLRRLSGFPRAVRESRLQQLMIKRAVAATKSGAKMVGAGVMVYLIHKSPHPLMGGVHGVDES